MVAVYRMAYGIRTICHLALLLAGVWAKSAHDTSGPGRQPTETVDPAPLRQRRPLAKQRRKPDALIGGQPAERVGSCLEAGYKQPVAPYPPTNVPLQRM